MAATFSEVERNDDGLHCPSFQVNHESIDIHNLPEGASPVYLKCN